MNNQFIVEGDILKIIIRNKTGKTYYALVDADLLKELNDFPGSWRLKVDRTSSYTNIYVYTHVINEKGIRTTLPLHRFVMKPESSSQLIDHINHDCLDNRRCNLRIVNGIQNSYNRYIQSNNKSGTPGIHWNQQKQKWEAELIYKGKSIFEKCYDNKEKAKADLEMVREAVTKVVMLSAIQR